MPRRVGDIRFGGSASVTASAWLSVGLFLTGSALAGDAPLVSVPDALERSDVQAYDGFATAIAATGDGVLVACRGADGVATNSGAVHFFRDLGDGLVEVQKITPTSAELEAEYGHAIAASGAIAAVGVPRATGGGAVGVLSRSNDSWEQSAVLLSSWPASADDDAFGEAVAVRSDGLIAVGVPGATVNGEVAAGIVELFEFVDGDWQATATLTGSEPAENDRFGAALAFVQNRLVVGLPFDDASGPDAGAIEIFKDDRIQGWAFDQAIVPEGPEAFGYFGRRVASDGDRVVVGAPRLDVAGQDAGAAFVLRMIAGILFEEAVILPPDPGAYDDFGDAVAIQGDRVVIGAPADSRAGVYVGAVRLYELGGSDASPVLCMVPDGNGYAFMGTAVGMVGPWLLGGAPLASSDGDYAGGLYVADTVSDCDGSGVLDVIEISNEPGSDINGNGILDRCECPADLDGNGLIDGGDLGAFFIFWGECQFDGCPADFNEDKAVDGIDLGILFSAWGPCT